MLNPSALNITSKPIHIFLADDDAEDRVLFQETLNGTGFNANLILFEEGAKLTRFLKTGTRPHIIFLDLRIPGMDGKQCLRKIRTDNRYDDIPVVIFTGTTAGEDTRETFAAGANLYVPKNVFIRNNIKALAMILETTLTRSHLSPTPEKYVLRWKNGFAWI